MRVLAVPQILNFREAERERLGEMPVVAEPRRDRRLVRGCHRECLGREPPPSVAGEPAVLAQLLEHLLVLLRARDGRHVLEVLCRRAQHRRPADVDHLDGLLLVHAPLRDRGAERIEVDADEVERFDLLLGEGGGILCLVASGEDPAVDARMQRLHASAEHLGRVRDVLDARDVDAQLGERRRRAAAGDELEAEVGEAAGEGFEPCLVVHRNQRAHRDSRPRTSSRITRGSSLCSTACTRSRSVSTVSSG